MSVQEGNRIVVVGAGAAGLVTAKLLIENGFQVVIFEQGHNVGGVWNYSESSAMYDSLRTNLPKEIMAFSIEDPFPDYCSEDRGDHSFLTHQEVQSYLEDFATKHALLEHMKFNHTVTSVRKADNSHLWTVEASCGNLSSSVQTDAVVICNGHFNVPHTPENTPGLKHFKGVCYHSSAYDRIKPSLAGKNVLVVGSNSSGTDMARELLTIAHTVYVPDRSSTCDVHAAFTNIASNLHVLPGIQRINEVGCVVFTNGVECSVDVILWCTGYLYDCPFLNATTNTADTTNTTNLTHTINSTNTTYLPCPVELPQQRCVRPLYQQLFAIEDPSLAFVGLPFRVVPFPLFYYQAQYVAAVFSKRAHLPTVDDQYAWLAAFEANLVDNGEYSTKYHFLGGPPQWEYCRFLAVKSGLVASDGGEVGGRCSASPPPPLEPVDASADAGASPAFHSAPTKHKYTPQQHALYLSMLESIYDDNMEHRVLYPGAPDTYRERVYKVDRQTLRAFSICCL